MTFYLSPVFFLVSLYRNDLFRLHTSFTGFGLCHRDTSFLDYTSEKALPSTSMPLILYILTDLIVIDPEFKNAAIFTVNSASFYRDISRVYPHKYVTLLFLNSKLFIIVPTLSEESIYVIMNVLRNMIFISRRINSSDKNIYVNILTTPIVSMVFLAGSHSLSFFIVLH